VIYVTICVQQKSLIFPGDIYAMALDLIHVQGGNFVITKVQ
jgi:hypothetical protein